jgi:hypothetical protein
MTLLDRARITAVVVLGFVPENSLGILGDLAYLEVDNYSWQCEHLVPVR